MTKAEIARIQEIAESFQANADSLKVPLDSILQRLHRLGVTGKETDAELRKFVSGAIDYLRDGAKELNGAYADVKTVGSIIDKIFNQKA
jgi:hypothetical protein